MIHSYKIKGYSNLLSKISTSKATLLRRRSSVNKNRMYSTLPTSLIPAPTTLSTIFLYIQTLQVAKSSRLIHPSCYTRNCRGPANHKINPSTPPS